MKLRMGETKGRTVWSRGRLDWRTGKGSACRSRHERNMTVSAQTIRRLALYVSPLNQSFTVVHLYRELWLKLLKMLCADMKKSCRTMYNMDYTLHL